MSLSDASLLVWLVLVLAAAAFAAVAVGVLFGSASGFALAALECSALSEVVRRGRREITEETSR